MREKGEGRRKRKREKGGSEKRSKGRVREERKREKEGRGMGRGTRSLTALFPSCPQCLSYVEDSLMSLNDRSIMLADTLLEAGDANFTEVLPKVAESLR